MQQLSLWDYRPPSNNTWRNVLMALFALSLIVSPLMAFAVPVVNNKRAASVVQKVYSVQVSNDPPQSSPVPNDTSPVKTSGGMLLKRISRPTSNIALNQYDDLNLTDVERVYNQIAWLLGREPGMDELLFMTISAEYWIFTQSDVGQEAVARNYYHFCGNDGCERKELLKFLSGYQPWFGRNARTDSEEKIKALAEKMYNLMVNKYNYDYANGTLLKSQIWQILNKDYAVSQGWASGICDSCPRQWITAPADKIGGKRGYGGNDDAISCINVGGGMLFCFFTYQQERNLTL